MSRQPSITDATASASPIEATHALARPVGGRVPRPSTRRHQLLVVGNGFDLECGLKTRFIDFFRPRFDLVEGICAYTEEEWCATVRENDLTIWDFILWRRDNHDWCDVEGTIATWVVRPEGTESIERASRTAQRVREYPFARGAYTLSRSGRLKGEKADESFVIGNAARFVWMAVGALRAHAFEQEDLFPLLSSELTRLETAFARYLRGEVERSPDYCRRSHELFARIAADGMDEADGQSVETTVLTFNYTRPFTDRTQGADVADEDVINIHGHMEGEVIFGIDGTDCMDDLDALPFTKTYRVVVAGTHMPTEIIHGPGHHLREEGVLTVQVKFYGHSLGEADYSYFQSIFDGVDLYGSRTRLIFYYRPWDIEGTRVSDRVARTTMVKSVAQLLNTYGSTLDNKEHGKNLMHKLLLEGRLEVKRI